MTFGHGARDWEAAYQYQYQPAAPLNFISISNFVQVSHSAKSHSDLASLYPHHIRRRSIHCSALRTFNIGMKRFDIDLALSLSLSLSLSLI